MCIRDRICSNVHCTSGTVRYPGILKGDSWKCHSNTYMFLQDIALVAVGALGYLAGAAALANYANRWRSFRDNQFQSTIDRITNATGAAAVSAL